MSLVKANGNMYPWVTHCHSHLRGACPHKCPYCYVQAIGKRFGGDAHKGPLCLDTAQLDIKYGAGRTIFVEHASDLFAEAVKRGWLELILDHCRQWPDNTYVFQTRNVGRLVNWFPFMPERVILGTTIETDNDAPGAAPHPHDRALGISMLRGAMPMPVTFVTIEPVLDFDVRGMLALLSLARPDFVNIGADSKGCGLREPSAEKVLALIEGVREMGIEIRQKTNLERLLKGGGK